ncbi:MAG TPA: glycosyltransferase family 87 protein [Acidisarcina sp.]
MLVGLFCLATALFLFNARSNQSYGDFIPVYASARCLVRGLDPYSLTNAQAQLNVAGADMSSFTAEYWPEHPLDYPPLTYYVLSPVGLFDYAWARNIWLVLGALAFIAGAAVTVHFSPLPARQFVIAGASAVLVTSSVLLRLGQISSLAIGFTVAGAMLFAARRHLAMAACLLLLAAALKPQLAGPIMFYFCFPRQTRKFALSALAAFCGALALSCLLFSLNPKTAHWMSELSGGINSSSALSAAPMEQLQTGLIHLQALTMLVSTRPIVAGVLTVGMLGILVLALAAGLRKLERHPARDWIALAAVAVLTLLLVYHRTYDMRMSLLTLPALGLLWRAAPKLAALLSFLTCFLLFSTAIVLVRLLSPHFSHAVTHGFLFRLLVERQQALFVFLTAIAWVAVTFIAGRYKMDPENGASYTQPAALSQVSEGPGLSGPDVLRL